MYGEFLLRCETRNFNDTPCNTERYTCPARIRRRFLHLRKLVDVTRRLSSTRPRWMASEV
jgi:hypothetical protein